MKALLSMGICAVAILAPAYASDRMEPSFGLQSEAVIRQALESQGIAADRVTISGQTALVELKIDRRPAVLEFDRLHGGYRVIKGDQEARKRFARLPLPVTARPAKLAPK